MEQGTALSSRGRTAEARLGVQTWGLLLHLPMASHLPLLFKPPGLAQAVPSTLSSTAIQCHGSVMSHQVVTAPPAPASAHPDGVILIPIGHGLVCICPSL